MTIRDNQAATVQPLEPNHDGTDPESQLADYIRHVVDSAPRPTSAQLARLAGLLRNTDDDPDVPS